MIAKLAYLTSPAPDRFVLNFQIEKDPLELYQLEISKGQLAGILITGTDLALRESSIHRVQPTSTENANGSIGA